MLSLKTVCKFKDSLSENLYYVRLYLKLTLPYTAKNIRRFYGKITDNQLPVHFPLFFTGARKHFQEPGTVRKQKDIHCFWSYIS